MGILEQYGKGEMCSVGRKIYQCIKRTRRYNTWVEEHRGETSEYWVMIYESPHLHTQTETEWYLTPTGLKGGSTIWAETIMKCLNTIH